MSVSDENLTFTAALWAVNVGKPLNGIDGWAASIDAQMAKAKAEGADLLLIPEYACKQWLSFAPDDLGLTGEIAWMADRADSALAAIEDLASKHDMALLAGTMPVHADEPLPEGAAPYFNRAHLFLPDGRRFKQDKLCLTPSERDPEGWNLSTGHELQIVEFKGMKLGTLICLDVEMPALSSKLANQELDLLLVPSDTGKLSGYSRVFSCAKARAVELQTAVLAVGITGTLHAPAEKAEHVSGCSVFLPCEEPLGYTGAFAEIAASPSAEGDGEMLIAKDIPIGKIREIRAGAAEVWPGAWSAGHVSVRGGV